MQNQLVELDREWDAKQAPSSILPEFEQLRATLDALQARHVLLTTWEGATETLHLQILQSIW